MTFQALNLIEPILKAVAFEGYTEPIPYPRTGYPCILEGKDILASAQTGTGKTAAFAIPYHSSYIMRVLKKAITNILKL